MPIRDIRRYRHPAEQGRRFRPLAADGWEIPIPGRVQDLENWRDGVSELLIGTAVDEDFAYFCGITVGVATPYHIPDTHLVELGLLDFAPVITVVSVIIGMFGTSGSGGREWRDTLRMSMGRGFRVDEDASAYVTRRVRIRYEVIY